VKKEEKTKTNNEEEDDDEDKVERKCTIDLSLFRWTYGFREAKLLLCPYDPSLNCEL